MGTQVKYGVKLSRAICQKRTKRICHLQWLEEMQGISRVGKGKVREAP